MTARVLSGIGVGVGIVLMTTMARAETIEINSGDSDVLARNFCTAGEFAPAVVIEKHPAWSILPGTKWLHPDGTNLHTTCSTFSAVFELPEGYGDPRFTASVYVDDNISVSLNGRSLGSGGGFSPPASRFDSSRRSDFRAGRNVVEFEATSGFGAFGVDFSVVVTYEPGDPVQDTDEDGMPDWWERQSLLDPDDRADAEADADRDGLVNSREFELGSDPRRRDSDEDSLDDGEELDRGTDPTEADSDGDGFDDGDEVEYGSDPTDRESVPLRAEIVIRSGIDQIFAGPCPGNDLIPAVTLEKIEAWDRIPDTEWIHPSPAGTRRNCAVYVVPFALPEIFTSPKLHADVLVDGSASATLNGHAIGAFDGFHQPPGSVDIGRSDFFVAGENELLLQFQTDGGGDGLDFIAVVTYVPSSPFMRGNANRDTRVDISDGICILESLFRGTCDLQCLDAADVNDNGIVETADAIRLLGFLFSTDPAPPDPGPWTCGRDQTADQLDPRCVSSCP